MKVNQTSFVNILEIARNEQAIEGLKSSRKGVSDEITTKKVDSYALLLADLLSSQVSLTAKGKLPTNVSKQLKSEMLEAGITEACVKRYVENTTGLIRALEKSDRLSAYSRVAMRHVVNNTSIVVEMEADGLTTEAKIKRFAFGEPDRIEALAKQISGGYELIAGKRVWKAGLEAGDRTRLDEMVKVLDDLAKTHASKEAQAIAQAEDDASSISATVEALEEAAA